MASRRKSQAFPGLTFEEREDLVTAKVNTHVPSKWRFVDLETGEVWMPTATGRLVRKQDIVFHRSEDA